MAALVRHLDADNDSRISVSELEKALEIEMFKKAVAVGSRLTDKRGHVVRITSLDAKQVHYSATCIDLPALFLAASYAIMPCHMCAACMFACALRGLCMHLRVCLIYFRMYVVYMCSHVCLHA